MLENHSPNSCFLPHHLRFVVSNVMLKVLAWGGSEQAINWLACTHTGDEASYSLSGLDRGGKGLLQGALEKHFWHLPVMLGKRNECPGG